MALKLIKGIPNLKQEEQPKSREAYLVACLREEASDPKFSDWERNFIASLGRHLAQGRTLTEKQREILQRIWAK